MHCFRKIADLKTKERFLVNLQPSAIFETEPAKRNEQLLSPQQDIAKFTAKENATTSAAMQKPISNLIDGIKNQIREIVKLPIKIAQTPVDIATGIVSKTVETLGKVAATAIDTPLNVTKTIITTPFGIIGNTIKHILDIGVKLPTSATNVMASYLGRVPMKVSEVARKIQEKPISVGERIKGITNSVGSKVRELKLPGTGLAEEEKKSA